MVTILIKGLHQVLLDPVVELIELDLLSIVQLWVLGALVHLLWVFVLQLLHEELSSAENLGNGTDLKEVTLRFLAIHSQVELDALGLRVSLVLCATRGIDLHHALTLDDLVNRYLILLQEVLVVALEHVRQKFLILLL